MQSLKEKIDIIVDAWYRRTLAATDLDTGERTPPPTMKFWSETVKIDIESLFTQYLQEKVSEIEKLSIYRLPTNRGSGLWIDREQVLALLAPTKKESE